MIYFTLNLNLKFQAAKNAMKHMKAEFDKQLTNEKQNKSGIKRIG